MDRVWPPLVGGGVSVWSTENSKRIAGPFDHSGAIKRLQFTPNGALLIGVSDQARATVWDVATDRRLYGPLDVGNGLTDLDVARNGKLCAIATLQKITILEVASGKCFGLPTLGGSFSFVRFLNDSHRTLVGQVSRPLQLFDVDTERSAWPSDKDINVDRVAVSDDKRAFLAGRRVGALRLWNCEDGNPASPPFDFPLPVQSAYLDSTGHWAVACTENSHLVLWNARTGELLWSVATRCLWPLLSDRVRFGARPLLFVGFSLEGRSLCLITSAGLFVSLQLDRDRRSSNDLNTEVALRSGQTQDGMGGLRALSTDELATLWASNAHNLVERQSASSRFEKANFGQQAKAGISTTQVPVR